MQDYLNAIPQNFELNGETCRSPKRVLRENSAHCIEGAILSAAILWYHDSWPLVMHLKTDENDQDHVIAIFREKGYYGAISKTNHAVLRYRDAVYRTPRELALSYFNEYFLSKNGKKTMIGFTDAIDLKKISGDNWLYDENDLWELNDTLYHARHYSIAPKILMRNLRTADSIEMAIMCKPEQKPLK